jgi:hypothetical protein
VLGEVTASGFEFSASVVLLIETVVREFVCGCITNADS